MRPPPDLRSLVAPPLECSTALQTARCPRWMQTMHPKTRSASSGVRSRAAPMSSVCICYSPPTRSCVGSKMAQSKAGALVQVDDGQRVEGRRVQLLTRAAAPGSNACTSHPTQGGERMRTLDSSDARAASRPRAEQRERALELLQRLNLPRFKDRASDPEIPAARVSHRARRSACLDARTCHGSDRWRSAPHLSTEAGHRLADLPAGTVRACEAGVAARHH